MLCTSISYMPPNQDQYSHRYYHMKLVKKLYNQLVLTTEKALSYLRFIGTVPEEEF